MDKFITWLVKTIVNIVIWGLLLVGLGYVLVALSGMGAEEMSRW